MKRQCLVLITVLLALSSGGCTAVYNAVFPGPPCQDCVPMVPTVVAPPAIAAPAGVLVPSTGPVNAWEARDQ